jgi:mannose-1-phosphate guanylyltransferase/mannose-6-phosphate isomerase
VSLAQACAEEGLLVTFGIPPTRPETGFGYIRYGQPLSSGFQVERFVEKPDKANAERLLAGGSCFWNSGMFLFHATVYLEELKTFAPGIMQACAEAWANRRRDKDFWRVDPKAFATSPHGSIDYAVMEHTSRACVVPLSADWTDLGAWEAFYEAQTPDADHNVCFGDVLARDTKSSYLHSTHRLVAALGIHNLAVIETADAVLVMDRDKAGDVKGLVEELSLAGREEAQSHVRVFRPWGWYERLAKGERFQVKRIMLNPGASLSLQFHHHRAEHWVVVQGTARVTTSAGPLTLKEDQSVYIPLGETHRLENPGRIPLEIIEVQTGAYLGEDDIVRLEDPYGREGKE